MKFAIITHAEHKIYKQEIFAYEPYVREMNLWLKYVDEVKIVAPVSKEEVNSIESKYLFYRRHCEHRDAILSEEQIAMSQTSRNDESQRHSQLDWGSHDLDNEVKIPDQVWDDENESHPEPVEGCMDNNYSENESKLKSLRQAQTDKLKLVPIPFFDITSFKNGVKAVLKIPKICIQTFKTMQWADHIHLRCPGNVGLLGSFIQVFFPSKFKTVKYAGNWDPKSKQPLSYRMQKWIISNTFLTRNCKVLVYGEWPNQSKNIVAFFTATYSEKEMRHPQLDWGSHDLDNEEQIPDQVRDDEIKEQITTSQTIHNDENESHPEHFDNAQYKPVEGFHDLEFKSKSLRQAQTDINSEQIPNQVGNDEMERHSEQGEAISSKEQMLNQVQHDKTERHSALDAESVTSKLKFIYVGGLTLGKQPLLSVQTIHKLKQKGYKVQLDLYGDGSERKSLEDYIKRHKLQNEVILHGNCSKEIIKKAYQKSHFLLFISKSEGWPKVVAEAMFWGCLPISSSVSCISYMLGKGSRGAIVNSDVNEIVLTVEDYIKNSEKFEEQTKNAIKWSRQFTLEKFEREIGELLNSPLKRGQNEKEMLLDKI